MILCGSLKNRISNHGESMIERERERDPRSTSWENFSTPANLFFPTAIKDKGRRRRGRVVDGQYKRGLLKRWPLFASAYWITLSLRRVFFLRLLLLLLSDAASRVGWHLASPVGANCRSTRNISAKCVALWWSTTWILDRICLVALC